MTKLQSCILLTSLALCLGLVIAENSIDSEEAVDLEGTDAELEQIYNLYPWLFDEEIDSNEMYTKRAAPGVMRFGKKSAPGVMRFGKRGAPGVMRFGKKSAPGVMRFGKRGAPGVMRFGKKSAPGVMRFGKRGTPGVMRFGKRGSPGIMRFGKRSCEPRFLTSKF